MSSLLSTKDNTPVSFLKGQEASQAYYDGKVQFPDGVTSVTIYDPKKPYEPMNVPLKQLRQALEEGYILENSIQKIAREEVGESPWATKGSTVVNKIMTGLTLGVTDIVSNTDVPQNNQELLEKYKRGMGREEHPVSGFLGEVGGTVATHMAGVGMLGWIGKLFTKGGTKLVQKQVTKNLIQGGVTPQLAAKTATSFGEKLKYLGKTQAALGFLESTPAALTHGLYADNWKAAGETLAWGTGTGLAFGTVLQGGRGLSKALSGVQKHTTDFNNLPGAIKAILNKKGDLNKTEGLVDIISDPKFREQYMQGIESGDSNAIEELVQRIKDLKADAADVPLRAARGEVADAAKIIKDSRVRSDREAKAAIKAPNTVVVNDLEDSFKAINRQTEIYSDEADRVLSRMPEMPLADMKSAMQRQLDIVNKKTKISDVDKGVKEYWKRKLKELDKEFGPEGSITGGQARELNTSFRRDAAKAYTDAWSETPLTQSIKMMTRDFGDAVKHLDSTGEYGELMLQMSQLYDIKKPMMRTFKAHSKRDKINLLLNAKGHEGLSGQQIADKEVLEGYLSGLNRYRVPDAEGLQEKVLQAGADYRAAKTYEKDKLSMGKDSKEFNERYFPEESALLNDAELVGKEAGIVETLFDKAFGRGQLTVGKIASRRKELTELAKLEADPTYVIPESKRNERMMALAQLFGEHKESAGFGGISASQLLASSVGPEAIKLVESAVKKRLHTWGRVGATAAGGLMYGSAGGILGGTLVSGALKATDVISGYIDDVAAKAARMDNTSKWVSRGSSAIQTSYNVAKGFVSGPYHQTGVSYARTITNMQHKQVVDPLTQEERKGLNLYEKPKSEREKKVNIWKVLNEGLAKVKNDPDAFAERMDQSLDYIADIPELKDQMVQQYMIKYLYLNEIIPRATIPLSPFEPDAIQWQPSDSALSEFTDALIGVMQPQELAQALLSNMITTNMVRAADSTNPWVMEVLREGVMSSITEEPTKVSYEQRLRASTFLGQPLTDALSPKSYLFFQSSFAPEEAEGTEPTSEDSSPIPGAPRMSSFNAEKVKDKYSTISSKLNSRE